VRPGAESRRCQIELSTAHESLWVNGDAKRLQQALWNVLSNAVKFTPEGGRIDVSIARCGSDVEVRVRDTGIGIAPDLLPRVFDRFVQADTSPARLHGGLGLGLAIVRHIVEASGGSVRAASDGLDAGATFVIVLPAGDGEVPAPRAARGAQALAGRSVLVLENHEDARRLVVDVLERQGAGVMETSTVDEAAAVLATHAPDVVIADIALGGETGFDVAPHVRASETMHGRSIGLLALSAYSDEDTRRRAQEAGFEAYLTKPWAVDELLDAIDVVMLGESRL
jgi:CheY-like chemotaxis protein